MCHDGGVPSGYLRLCRFPFEQDTTCNRPGGHEGEHAHENTYVGNLPTFDRELRTRRMCDTCGGPVEGHMGLGSTCVPCLNARAEHDVAMGLLRTNVELVARAAGKTAAEVIQGLMREFGLHAKGNRTKAEGRIARPMLSSVWGPETVGESRIDAAIRWDEEREAQRYARKVAAEGPSGWYAEEREPERGQCSMAAHDPKTCPDGLTEAQ